MGRRRLTTLFLFLFSSRLGVVELLHDKIVVGGGEFGRFYIIFLHFMFFLFCHFLSVGGR
jgi:hypothetical protein